tara:strand:- start:5208 stop:6359 length:1152 start_codon:yes stop_codon:yes gene_type:complete
MEKIIYHQVQPENVKSLYKEYDQVDFQLGFEGRSLLCNSVRLEGNIKVTNNGTATIADTDDVAIDCKIGAHSVIAGCVTQFQTKGVVENITDYPRLCKIHTECDKIENDMLNSNYTCELRSPHDRISNLMIRPIVPVTYGGEAAGKIANASAGSQTELPSFSIKPKICINNATGNIRLTDAQSGAVKLTFTLERNMGVLHGRALVAGNAYTYELSNLRVCYMSAPESAPQQVEMRCAVGLKSSINSAFSNTSSKVPAVCNSVSVSFIQQSHEYNGNFVNTAMEEPPSISKINYLFNDNTNQYVSYEIKDRADMIERGVSSVVGGSSNSSQLQKLSSNKGYVLGLNWNSYVDLSQQKFNIQLQTKISNLEPYIMFMFFHSRFVL